MRCCHWYKLYKWDTYMYRTCIWTFRLVPSPISTRLDWLVALPSWSWKVNVPSSAFPRDSMNISIMPVFLSKFILYFYNTQKRLMQKQTKCSVSCTACWVMFHVLRVCFCIPLTSPWEIILSLNTYSTFPLAEIFSACNQKRTLPFSSNSTASSDFRGMTEEEGWKWIIESVITEQ